MSYDTEGLGIRIAQLRREKNLTQEEFATKLGISPQAVSKWETGMGCPDISLLPTIATELDITMDELFGKTIVRESPVANNTVDLPQEYRGLKLVGSWGELACYADQPAKQEDHLLSFSDNSEVDFREHLVTNYGAGEIVLVPIEELFSGAEKKSKNSYSAQDESSLVNGFDSFSFDISSDCNIKILPATEGKSGWTAEGSKKFMSGLSIEEEGNTLNVRASNPKAESVLSLPIGRGRKNLVTIFTTAPKIQSLGLRIRGSADLETILPILNAEISITGSGDAELGHVDNADVKIMGSGDFEAMMVNSATISVSGSGHVKIKRLTKDAYVKIAGSGDVDIEEGSVERLEAYVFGSGDIKATNLTVKDLEIEMQGKGDAVIGTVTGKSVERLSHSSRLKILNRG